ncbi:MAG: hypothetical protein R3F20_07560 [Planctomycetota bacterium]
MPLVGLLVVLVAPLASLLATSRLAARRRRLRGDHALQRRARASRAARERLAEAEAALRGGERGFHAALVRALQGFVGDKLDLPAGRLTASTAADILRPGGADAGLTDRVARFLEEMEAKEFGLASGDAEARARDHAVAEELIRDLDRSLGR